MSRPALYLQLPRHLGGKIMRKGNISWRGYFSLLTSSLISIQLAIFPTLNRYSGEDTLEAGVVGLGEGGGGGGRGIQAGIFSFKHPNGWMDSLQFYVSLTLVQSYRTMVRRR